MDTDALNIIRLHAEHPHAIDARVLGDDIKALFLLIDDLTQDRMAREPARSLQDVAAPPPPEWSLVRKKDEEIGRLSDEVVRLNRLIAIQTEQLRKRTPDTTEKDAEISRLTAIVNKQAELLLPYQHSPAAPPFLSEVDTYRDRALTLLIAEMDRQDQKWGPMRKQHPYKWNSIAMEELGEAAEATLLEDFGAAVDPKHTWEHEMTQLAAVAVQAVMGRLFSQDSAKKIFKQENLHGGVETP